MGTRKNSARARQSSWWNGIQAERHVIKMDPSNFDKIVTHSGKSAFVMFFAQWCGYSVAARHAFAALAEKLSKEGNPIIIGAVDCDESKDIALRFEDVRGFPSFIYFSKGAPIQPYQKQRTFPAFYSWLTSLEKEIVSENRRSSQGSHGSGSDASSSRSDP